MEDDEIERVQEEWGASGASWKYSASGVERELPIGHRGEIQSTLGFSRSLRKFRELYVTLIPTIAPFLLPLLHV